MEHAFVLSKGTEIKTSHLPENLAPSKDRAALQAIGKPSRLPDLEKQVILEALERHDWDRGQAARELGMHRSTLWRKIRRHGIHPR